MYTKTFGFAVSNAILFVLTRFGELLGDTPIPEFTRMIWLLFIFVNLLAACIVSDLKER
jgi:hypothetical protein